MSSVNTVIDECDSTNDLARQLAEAGAPHGSWVSARRQTSGRGRLGRRWESLEGNLFLSLIARLADTAMARTASWIPLVAGVAVAECLSELNPRLEIELKWPNDLWLERKKLGGILCEAASGRRDSFVVIGLGLNCARAPLGLDQETVSLAGLPADEIRGPLIASILSALGDLQLQGSAPMLARYERYAALKPGTPVEWRAGNQVSLGVVEGLGLSGELRVRASPEGPTIPLYAEDVRIRPT